jgi:hypothetical protein
MEGQGQVGGVMDSVMMAFNLGVSAIRQAGPNKSVVDIANELGEVIYSNLFRAYGGQHQEEFIRASTEYFLQIALLGFIIPTVCAYDEEFKNRLFVLIEAKLNEPQVPRPGPQGGGGIITP